MTNLLDVLPLDDPRRMMHEGDEAKAYPEHAKMRARQKEWDHIVAFLDWFRGPADYWIREPRPNWQDDEPLKDEFGEERYDDEGDPIYPSSHIPCNKESRQLACEFMGVDYDKWWREKEMMARCIAATQGDEESIEWLRVHPLEEPAACECDNTHRQNDTVCRWCWAHGRRHWNDPTISA